MAWWACWGVLAGRMVLVLFWRVVSRRIWSACELQELGVVVITGLLLGYLLMPVIGAVVPQSTG